MQMRYHPSVIKLKDSINSDTSHDVLMKYYAQGKLYYLHGREMTISLAVSDEYRVHYVRYPYLAIRDVYEVDTVNIDADTSKG